MATKNGVHISFEHDNCQLIYPNRAVFNITQKGHLYYLKNTAAARNATCDLHTWPKIWGYCNESDIKKLPNLVKGMKIKPTPNYASNCVLGITHLFPHNELVYLPDIYLMGPLKNHGELYFWINIFIFTPLKMTVFIFSP